MSPEQKAHLVGISEYALAGLRVYGEDDIDLAHGAFNTAFLGSYYPVLSLTPEGVQLQLWRIRARRVQTVEHGKVQIHPSVDGRMRKPSGPPDYDHEERYGEDSYAGTRLAAHAMLWMMQDGKPADG